MKQPLDPRRVVLEPFSQLCWLGVFTTAYSLLSMLWGASTRHGRPLSWAAVSWLCQFLVPAVALALAWGARRVARERGETKRGLAMAAFFAMHWWGALFLLRITHDGGELQSWMVRGASVWATWVAYRFFWAHSRTLGRTDSGTRSSGLLGLLLLCLPALTFSFVDFILWSLLERHPFSATLVIGLMLVEHWLVGVMLLWAIGKVSLVSAREQRRERPGLPRAIGSSLVLLLVSGSALFAQSRRGLLVPTPWDPLTVMLMLSPLLVASLGSGLLAHRLSASVGDAGPAPARFSTDLRTWARSALQKKPPNPHLVELGPFYQLCWLGLLSVLLNLLFVLWMISVSLLVALWGPGPSFGHPVAIALTGGFLVLFLMAWRFTHQRQKGRQQARAARGVTSMRPRLQSRFDALRDKLREFSGDASARLVLTPETAVVLSTARSNHEPLVEVTAGFWSTYASTPHLMEAAVAHEAGHIAARDVERFLRMLSLMRTLAWFFLPVAVVLAGSATTSFELITLLGVGLALALAWSALLVAREVQADVFAVKVLGDRRPLEALLESQRSLRAAQSGGRTLPQRLRAWLLQPNLRWRTTLPALRGHLGRRVEVKLGLATAAFIGISYYGTEFVTLVLMDDQSLRTWILRVMGGWIAWISYHFLWIRSRAQGNGDSGARSTGLRSLLCFCLPGLAFLGVGGVLLSVTNGTPLVESTVKALHFVEDLLARVVLLWATAQVALVSARERRRERPGLPRAVLSLLGILLLTVGVLFVVRIVSGLVPSIWPQLKTFLHPIATAVGLVTGLVAHRFAAPARTSAPRMKPRDPRRVELEPFHQVFRLGLLANILFPLFVFWGASTPHGQSLALTGSARAIVFLLVQALVLVLALALAWGALRVAREVQAETLAQKARRLEVKLGLATAVFFALVWWIALRMLIFVPESGDLGAWAIRGACAWGAWMLYRFFWARNRSLGSRDSGARFSGLMSLLYFCLTGLALFLADGITAYGRYGVMEGVLLPTIAVLLWAAGRVSLVSAREQRRERPGFPRAVLSLLGLLALGAGLTFSIAVPTSLLSVLSERGMLILAAFSLLAASLIAGLLTPLLAKVSGTSSRPCHAGTLSLAGPSSSGIRSGRRRAPGGRPGGGADPSSARDGGGALRSGRQ